MVDSKRDSIRNEESPPSHFSLLNRCTLTTNIEPLALPFPENCARYSHSATFPRRVNYTTSVSRKLLGSCCHQLTIRTGSKSCEITIEESAFSLAFWKRQVSSTHIAVMFWKEVRWNSYSWSKQSVISNSSWNASRFRCFAIIPERRKGGWNHRNALWFCMIAFAFPALFAIAWDSWCVFPFSISHFDRIRGLVQSFIAYQTSSKPLMSFQCRRDIPTEMPERARQRL